MFQANKLRNMILQCTQFFQSYLNTFIISFINTSVHYTPDKTNKRLNFYYFLYALEHRSRNIGVGDETNLNKYITSGFYHLLLKGGTYLQDLFDNAVGLPLLLVGFLEIFAIVWIYGKCFFFSDQIQVHQIVLQPLTGIKKSLENRCKNVFYCYCLFSQA